MRVRRLLEKKPEFSLSHSHRHIVIICPFCQEREEFMHAMQWFFMAFYTFSAQCVSHLAAFHWRVLQKDLNCFCKSYLKTKFETIMPWKQLTFLFTTMSFTFSSRSSEIRPKMLWRHWPLKWVLPFQKVFKNLMYNSSVVFRESVIKMQ